MKNIPINTKIKIREFVEEYGVESILKEISSFLKIQSINEKQFLHLRQQAARKEKDSNIIEEAIRHIEISKEAK